MKRGLALLLAIVALTIGSAARTTAQGERLSVAYVTGHEEGGYLLNDLSGFSRLSVIINDAGATVREIELDGPISDDIDLVVLNGPKRPPLTDGEISRVWSYLGRGGNLLILTDPRPNSGLHAGLSINRLLWQDYGIRWRADTIMEAWFTPHVAHVVTRLGYRFQPRRMAGLSTAPVSGHPISDLPARFDLAVYYWLGSSIEVQAPAPRGDPFALLASRSSPFGDTPFGEATYAFGQPAFNADDQPELNIGEDTLGQLILGAAVEDRETGARIVLFSDSDLFKNGYGLEYTADAGVPLFSGNDLLARSMVRWLLRQPLDEIEMTPNYVWIAVDGDPEDWSGINPAFSSENTPIESISMARSDRASYLLIVPQDRLMPVSGIIIDVFDSRGNPSRISVEGSMNVARVQSGGQASRSFLVESAVGDGVELRLPADALPVNDLYVVAQVCLTSETIACAETSISRPERSGLEPRGRLLVPNVPIARVDMVDGVDLVMEPNGMALAALEDGTFVNVYEVDDTGVWARVQSEGLEGWIPLNTLELAFDLSEPGG